MRRAVVVGLSFSCLLGCGAPKPDATVDTPPMPRPGPRATPQGVRAKNDACIGCHREAAETWRSSLHAAAFSNPVFGRSFAREPNEFCVGCHAPEGVAQADLGVACITCHDPSGTGAVLAAPRADAKDAPHPVRRARAFAGDAACAGCHEFAFPDIAARGDDGAKMQRTIEEHGRSRYASTSCASCHMPRGSHAFAVASDPAMLKSALDVTARREGEKLVLVLTATNVGHAVPTGDLFRRLLVVATAGDVRREVPLGRRFRFERRGDARIQREIADDRVHNTRTVEIALPKGPATWHLDWQRVGGADGDKTIVEDSVRLYEGRVD